MWINENAFISHLCCVCVCVVFVANYQQLFLQGRPYFRSVFNRGGNSEMARNGWREGGPQTDERRHCLGQLGGDRAQGTGKGVHVSTGKDSSNPNTLFFFFLSSSFFFKFRKTFFSFLSFFLPFSVWDHVVHILCIRFSVHDRSAEYQLSKPLRPCVSEPDLEQGSCAIHTNYLCPWILWLFGSCICHKSIFNTGRVCYQIQGLEIVEISKKKYDDKCWNNEH